MANDVIIEPRDEELDAFWVRARTRGKIYPLEAIAGQEAVITLCPPAFSLGDTKEMATRLAALVVEGKKRATSSWQASYELAGETLPHVGELGIICDGDGLPQALVRTTKVELIPFKDVGPDVAEAEGEGDLPSWIDDHRDFFTREMLALTQDSGDDYTAKDADCECGDAEFDLEGNVVVEYFEVLYSREV